MKYSQKKSEKHFTNTCDLLTVIIKNKSCNENGFEFKIVVFVFVFSFSLSLPFSRVCALSPSRFVCPWLLTRDKNPTLRNQFPKISMASKNGRYQLRSSQRNDSQDYGMLI